MEKRYDVNIPAEISDETMADLLASLKNFDFDGRSEFWRFGRSTETGFDEIEEALFEHNYKKAREIFSNICTAFYRDGFVRGCQAGFDDLGILLNITDNELTKDAFNLASCDATRRMFDAVPEYDDKDQRVKEWRLKYKKNPSKAPLFESANIRQK